MSENAAGPAAIFASGQGTNAREIIRYFRTAPIGCWRTVEIALIVCNKPGAGVLDHCRGSRHSGLSDRKRKIF